MWFVAVKDVRLLLSLGRHIVNYRLCETVSVLLRWATLPLFSQKKAYGPSQVGLVVVLLFSFITDKLYVTFFMYILDIVLWCPVDM